MLAILTVVIAITIIQLTDAQKAYVVGGAFYDADFDGKPDMPAKGIIVEIYTKPKVHPGKLQSELVGKLAARVTTDGRGKYLAKIKPGVVSHVEITNAEIKSYIYYFGSVAENREAYLGPIFLLKGQPSQ